MDEKTCAGRKDKGTQENFEMAPETVLMVWSKQMYMQLYQLCLCKKQETQEKHEEQTNAMYKAGFLITAS